MEAHLYLELRSGMVSSATDFTWKWCVNMGLSSDQASRMALAVDELLTDILLFGYPDKRGYVELWFQYSFHEIEIIVQETGEPFDPDRHPYSKQNAIEEGDFEGAGLEIIRNMTDHFLFINRGKDGKEFRLVKRTPLFNSRQNLQDKDKEPPEAVRPDNDYLLTPVTSEDAEDIAKLIYKSYDYSYTKDDLYYPKRIETALQHGYKFGVIIRTSYGGPAGYFAVTRSTDSQIGEIGEVVVSPEHRKKGLMKQMLDELITLSRNQGLLGVFGKALTVHPISQKVNQKFGFKSTALLLAKSSGSIYKGIRETYPQRVSMLLDFLPLTNTWNGPEYLPERYESILRKIYEQFEMIPAWEKLPDTVSRENRETNLDLKINYESHSALIITRNFGNTFEESCTRIFKSLEELQLSSLYIDLPINHPWIERAVEWLHGEKFILAGLMPFFHKENDFIRLQKINVPLDFEIIECYTETAKMLKSTIKSDYDAIQ